MAKMTVNGCVVEFNVFEAESAGRFQRANEKLIKDVDKLKKTKKESFADLICAQCNIIFEFVDTIFGEGTHEKMFGEKHDLKLCSEAYLQILKEIAAERNSLPSFENVTPMPNRATRRANGTGKAKK